MTRGWREAALPRVTGRQLAAVLLTAVAAGLAGVPSAPRADGAAVDARPVAPRTGTGRADPPPGPWAALGGDVRPTAATHAVPTHAEPGEADGAEEPVVPGPVVPEAPGALSGTAPGAPPWSPPAPLPAQAAPGERVDVVLSPHPDDETLSLGVWIADAVARGERVIVVSLTDGRSTGAVTRISARLGRPVSRDEIARARGVELRDAATQLGVRPGDVYPAHLDDERGQGGTRATQDEIAAVIRVFSARYPAATFATMSWRAERHPDHLGAGLALRAAAGDGTVRAAVFAISRLWWALPSPPATEVLPANPVARRRVLLAARAYDRWDPAGHRLAVGWTSVRPQFTALVADPRDRVHG